MEILWISKRIIITILMFFVEKIIPKDNNLVLFSCKNVLTNKEMFLYSSKYLFLYISSLKDKKVKAIWLCDDYDMLRKFKSVGLTNVFCRNDLKAINYILRARYWFFDHGISNISCLFYHNSNIKSINLWHGIPLKKICEDANSTPKHTNFYNKLFSLLRKETDTYVINGEYEQNCYITAFFNSDNKFKVLGSPRLDILFHDVPYSDLFMEKDFNQIKLFKEQGKNIFIYMPTFRDTGKNVTSWLKSTKLKAFLNSTNSVLICKLHIADINILDSENNKSIYKMSSDSDPYSILKYTNGLITDYSSIAYDYLLLDKPIIYHVPDLEEYQKTCRGFYIPYSEFAVGEITHSEDEIIRAMQNVMDNIDNYKVQRKTLRDKIFKYQDGKNCERVVEWIRSLSE